MKNINSSLLSTSSFTSTQTGKFSLMILKSQQLSPPPLFLSCVCVCVCEVTVYDYMCIEIQEESEGARAAFIPLKVEDWISG